MKENKILNTNAALFFIYSYILWLSVVHSEFLPGFFWNKLGNVFTKPYLSSFGFRFINCESVRSICYSVSAALSWPCLMSCSAGLRTALMMTRSSNGRTAVRMVRSVPAWCKDEVWGTLCSRAQSWAVVGSAPVLVEWGWLPSEQMISVLKLWTAAITALVLWVIRVKRSIMPSPCSFQQLNWNKARTPAYPRSDTTGMLTGIRSTQWSG